MHIVVSATETTDPTTPEKRVTVVFKLVFRLSLSTCSANSSGSAIIDIQIKVRQTFLQQKKKYSKRKSFCNDDCTNIRIRFNNCGSNRRKRATEQDVTFNAEFANVT